MTKLGFLLGAGASYPFGIPMMREFYEGFIEYIKNNRAHCMPLINQIVSDGPSTPDLEFLIQRIEEVRNIRKGLDVLGENLDKINTHIALADELRGYLDMFLIETCENFDQSKVKQKLSKLVKLANRHNAYVFTTNYDRLIEVAATSIGLKCSDGFEIDSTKPESKWNGDFSSHFKLIKLHGSVNWYEEEGSLDLFRLERGYSLPSHEYRLTHGQQTLRPLMIIPTLEKSMLKAPYAGLLTQFSDALKEIDLFIIIGNSLRDNHLRSTIIERASNLDIILINPAASDQTTIINNEGVTHAIPLGVEEFIDNGLGAFQKLLDEIENITETEQRSSRISSFATDLTAVADENRGMSKEAHELLNMLNNVSNETRLEALKSVSTSSHSAIITKVRELALRPGDETVRVAAIDALADARGTDAAEIFVEIISEPAPLLVRAEAALALHSLDNNVSKRLMLDVVKKAKNDTALESLFASIIPSEIETKSP